MKKCCKCKQEKPLDQFNFKYKAILLRQKACKDCTRSEVRSHYQKHKNYYLNKAYKRNVEVKYKATQLIGNYLSSHPCVDCGESDILVLEFDHKDNSNKYENVSHIIKKTGSLQKLKEEIVKCEVRCANCHRRKTALLSNHWKLLYNKDTSSAHSSTG